MKNLLTRQRERYRSQSDARPPPSYPHTSQHPGNNFVLGGGVAIFHVKSMRVVLCYHSRDQYYFLPKGRRDVHESCEQGAEREGFEESGYRNRLLPLPIKHRQPQPRVPLDARIVDLSTEPVWCQLMPATTSTQYILFWYVSETLPPQAEEDLDSKIKEKGPTPFGKPYEYPPAFPLSMTMKQRLEMEPEGYEPRHHEGTSADEEEELYTSELVDIEEARNRLGKDTVPADVVKIGWEAIQRRLESEGLLS